MKTASATAAAITGTVAALSDRELLAQTGNLARVERHLQGAIIDHLAEIEARSLFLRRGFASLFEYAVRELGYSDAAAGRRIAAMRLCADNPHTRERLRDGSLSLSAAAELQWAFDRQRRRVPPVAATATRRADTPQAATTPAVAALPTEPPLVLDAVGRQKLVEEAAGKSTRQVKRMLADLDPELAPAADRVRPLGNGRYELKALIDAECQRGLEQLAGLLSHVDPRMTVGQLVGRLVREALDRHDPSRRRPRTGSRPADVHAAPTPAAEPEADRRTASAPKQPARRAASPPKETARPAVSATSTAQTRPGCDGHAAPAPKSRASGRAIPAAVQREVWQRDAGRCRYVDPHTGRRCTSRHLLQIDHVLPYALGGGSDPANLRLLCHAHHRHRHRSASAVSPTRNPEDPSFLTHPCLVMDATTLPSRSPGARPSPPGAASRTAARFSTAATIALRCRQ